MNRVTVSYDRRHMEIRGPKGQLATLRSGRPSGFTDADVERAESVFRFSETLTKEQVNRTHRIPLGNRAVYIHVNTGPPTWWLPRMDWRDGSLMVGWLRGLVALSVKRAEW